MQIALPIRQPVERQTLGAAAVLLIGLTVMPVSNGQLPDLGEKTTQFANSFIVQQSITRQMFIGPTKEVEAKSNKESHDENSCLDPSELREKISGVAVEWVGTPYKFGGESREGIDCSALVQIIYRENNIELPRTSWEQFRCGVGIPKERLLPGDLVFFSTSGSGASHVGIYIGEKLFVSATIHKVEIQSLDDGYWANSYRGSRRVIS